MTNFITCMVRVFMTSRSDLTHNQKNSKYLFRLPLSLPNCLNRWFCWAFRWEVCNFNIWSEAVTKTDIVRCTIALKTIETYTILQFSSKLSARINQFEIVTKLILLKKLLHRKSLGLTQFVHRSLNGKLGYLCDNYPLVERKWFYQ